PDRLVVGHVGVPVLPGVGNSNRLAVLDDVREISDLGHPRLVVTPGQRGLDLAEAPREVAKLHGLEPLSWKPEHTVTTKSLENGREVRITQGLCEVHTQHRRPENL